MAKTNLIAGLDIGSGKMTCIAAVHDPQTNTLQVVAGRSVPCKGVKGGLVTDIVDTSAAARHLLSSIERECEQEISNLFVGVRGAHLESFTSHGSYHISRVDKEITQNDMGLAIENAKSVPIKNNHEIINVITQGFYIDKQRGIANPEGMEGSVLEVDVHITSGSATHRNNLLKAIQRAGYNVDGLNYGLVPLAEAVLTPEEKEIGTLLLDLGGETMSVGIYMDGILKFSRDIPYGCDLITRDLSHALHTSRQNAQEIKERYGVAVPTFLDEEGEIPVPSLDGRSTHNISKSYVLEIIQPRVEDLMEQVLRCVETSGYKNLLTAGVITGGGSQMPGVTDQCMNYLGLKEVRRGGVQRELVTSDDSFFDPEFSTAMALVLYASDQTVYNEYNTGSYEKSGSFLSKLKQWFKGDIFSN